MIIYKINFLQVGSMSFRVKHTKTLVFIDPCASYFPLVHKAKEKKYRTLVISTLCKATQVVESSHSFFQVNLTDENAVLDLVRKMDHTFAIDGLICGTQSTTRLSHKVANFLQKPLPSRLNRFDLIRETLRLLPLLQPSYSLAYEAQDLNNIDFPCILKSLDGKKIGLPTSRQEAYSLLDTLPQGILAEEIVQGTEYTLVGFTRHSSLSLLSVLEKVYDQNQHIGYLFAATLDSGLLTILNSYLQNVLSALGFLHGSFCAQLRFSQKGPRLLGLTTELAPTQMADLIQKATGLDYYETILKVLTYEPLSFQTKPFLNAAMTYTPKGHIIDLHEDITALRELMRKTHFTDGK